MSARVAGLLVAIAVVAILARGGDDPYRVRLYLTNASGLKDGSPVVIGGVTGGSVKVRVDDADRVVADLELDKGKGPVRRDATAAITATNFLGQKRVELDVGHASAAAPSGFVLPSSRVTTPTDLDQVLSVLDPDTRTRAMILLDEAGGAVLGRQVDIRTLFKAFPVGFHDAAAALRKLGADNRALRDVVAHTGRFVSEVNARRTALSRLVGAVGGTARVVATRRSALQSTLARAPGTLRTLQRFLAELDATARPLGPAARAIRRTAKPLSDTLAQVRPFTASARPTLSQATAAAPQLTTLATKATPLLRRAKPVVDHLAATSRAVPPVAGTLDNSADNIVAILENWSRAIQFRDGLGHVFRGEATVSAELLQSMVRRLLPNVGRRGKPGKRTDGAPGKGTPITDLLKPPSAGPPAPTPQLPKPVDKVLAGTEKALADLIGPPQQPKHDGGRDGTSILDFLLGP